MNYSIRPLDPNVDFPRLVELYNLVIPYPPTVENLQEQDANPTEGRISQHLVAVDEHNQLIGSGNCLKEMWMPELRFAVDVNVFPEWRRQGVGTRLYEESVAFGKAKGCDFLIGMVREDQPDGVRFAQKHQYIFARHFFGSHLTLSDFDETPFTAVLDKVKAGGIRFTTLADMDGQDATVLRKLYDVYAAAVTDEPATAAVGNGVSDFGTFLKTYVEAAWYRPEGQIIALDGDRWVGLGSVGLLTESNTAYNFMTGVDRAYRGRGIAQALKLLGIRYARGQQVDRIHTNNDSSNEPMLAINRKFGYQPEPGLFWIGRPVDLEGNG
ncbi:MAG: GNAT family N-acetyltransferase [Anaerolineae bacterium]